MGDGINAPERMVAAMQGLERAFPGCAVALVVVPFGSKPGRSANWVSNADQVQMLALLKTLVALAEGRLHAAKETRH